MLGKEIAALLQEINPMILENFNSSHQLGFKADKSIVTKTDRQVEDVLKPKLIELLPGSEIIAEESEANGSENIDKYFHSEFLWAVDPIDGTSNFAAGLPLFTVSIGLFKQTEEGYSAISGGISFPVFSEIYYTHKNKTILRNIYSNNESYITRKKQVDVPTLIIPNRFALKKVIDNGGRLTENIRLLGSTAADFLFVSIGKATATVSMAHIWDVAAGLAIAKTQNLFPRSLSTGQIKSSFTKDDFSYGHPTNHWRLKEPLVLCNDDYFQDVYELFKD